MLCRFLYRSSLTHIYRTVSTDCVKWKKITETNNQNKTETEKIILKTKHNRNKNKLNKNPWFKHGCSSTNFALLSWRLKFHVSCSCFMSHQAASSSYTFTFAKKKMSSGKLMFRRCASFFFKKCSIKTTKNKSHRQSFVHSGYCDCVKSTWDKYYSWVHLLPQQNTTMQRWLTWMFFQLKCLLWKRLITFLLITPAKNQHLSNCKSKRRTPLSRFLERQRAFPRTQNEVIISSCTCWGRRWLAARFDLSKGPALCCWYGRCPCAPDVLNRRPASTDKTKTS